MIDVEKKRGVKAKNIGAKVRRKFARLTVSLFKEYYLFHERLFSAVAEISIEN